MRKKSELIKELDELKAEKLQREREENRPFKIFTGLENWIYICEWKWKSLKTIRKYKFKAYTLMWDVIFSLEDEYVAK